MTILVIVESKTKAHKIQSYLGDQYKVVASNGHICDLPVSPEEGIGVDLDTFEPEWVSIDKQEDTIVRLKRLCKTSDQVILATDPDREGEAIAWHLQRILKLRKAARVTFHEITPDAIRRALQRPRKVDLLAVKAQVTRRVVDRLVGYQVSPSLSKAAGKRLSAGRVQSVALKLCVRREQEITTFKPQAYYELDIDYQGQSFKLDHSKFLADKHIHDKELVDNIMASVRVVSALGREEQEVAVQPRPPFITSTLQQVASTRLGLPPEETMKLAQKLFEEGLITYHRTDNPNISAEGFGLLARELEARYGIAARAVPIQRATAALAQGAHEAIRHTGVSEDEFTPSQQALFAASETRNLYRLIRERSLAAIAPDCVEAKKRLVLTSEPVQIPGLTQPMVLQWVWQGRVVITPGWRLVSVLEPSGDEESVFQGELAAGDTLKPVWQCRQKTTKAPDRFTESSLIKALEKLGLGRPSTYATIISNLKSRQYIRLVERKIHVQPIGKDIVASLESFAFMQFDFTRQVEEHLDRVAQGADPVDMLKRVNDDLKQQLSLLDPQYMGLNQAQPWKHKRTVRKKPGATRPAYQKPACETT